MADTPTPVPATHEPRAHRILGALAACLLPCLFCAPLLRGRVPYWADASSIFYPMMNNLAICLHHGFSALWCAFLAGGYCIHEAGQTGEMYPLNWLLYGLAPMPLAYSLSYLVHLCLASAGFYAFLRLHSTRPLAAVLGAALYAFNGHVAGHHIHINVLLALGWLPWTLCALHRSLQAPRAVPLLALSFGMMALCGHPQWLWMSCVILLLYAAFAPGAAELRLWQRLAVAAGGLALGGLVGAAQLLPTLVAVRAVHRGGANALSFATSFSLGLDDIPRLLLPNLHGNPTQGKCLVEGPWWWETAGFQGAVALCLAAFSLASCRWGRMGWLCLTLLLLGAAFALGEVNPAYQVLSKLPLVSSFRGAGRYLLLALVGVALAAARGCDALLRGQPPARPALARWIGFGLPAGIVLVVLMGDAVFADFAGVWQAPLHPASLRIPELTRADTLHNYFVGWEPLVIALAAVAAAVAIGLRLSPRRSLAALLAVGMALLELCIFWRSFVVTAPASFYSQAPPYLRPAQQAAAGSWGRLLMLSAPSDGSREGDVQAQYLEFLATGWGFPVLQGQDSLQPWEGVTKRHRAAYALTGLQPATVARGVRLATLYGLRWIVSKEGLPQTGFPRWLGSACVYENPRALPEAYLAAQIVPATTLEEQAAAVERPTFRPGVDCAADPELLPASSNAASPMGGTCRVSESRPGFLEVNVTTPATAVLVVQQNWHPGWRAWVDGRPTQVVRCNAINLGVQVPPCPRGSTVHVRFDSDTTEKGELLSSVSVGVLVGAWPLGAWWSRRRRRKRGG